MFKLRDFYHLAQLDPYFDRMIAEGAGMMVIAGIDSRPINALAGGSEEYLPGEVFLPSGLSGLFNILMQTMLVENPTAQAVVVAREKSLARVPRQLKRRIRLLPVDVGMLYDRQIANAIDFQPDLLVVDHLTLESAPAAFTAASQGLKVLASVDTALCSADRVILYLLRAQSPGTDRAEVLAARGWEAAEVESELDAALVFEPAAVQKVTRFVSVPPAVHPRQRPESEDSSPISLQAGLRVPLLAQDRLVGAMIIQSTQKGFFTPGETALLQTFANQAALAIQRAGLVDDLRAKIIELEAAQAGQVKKERMERELELARQVQQILLPRVFPQLPGFSIAACTEAARQVGGDFYDVIVLDDDHFGIVVADVSDKGMPAALYMGLSRSLLLAEAHRGLSPMDALNSVNRLLLELGDLNGFVSIFYAVVEISTRCMRYTRAGHERPWLLRSSAAGANFIQLRGSGMVLGVMDSAAINLSEAVLYLDRADGLVLFTDGLSDATDEQGRFFGGERLVQLLDSLVGQPAEKIYKGVFQQLSAYRGQSDPFDDMTLLVMEIL